MDLDGAFFCGGSGFSSRVAGIRWWALPWDKAMDRLTAQACCSRALSLIPCAAARGTIYSCTVRKAKRIMLANWLAWPTTASRLLSLAEFSTWSLIPHPLRVVQVVVKEL